MTKKSELTPKQRQAVENFFANGFNKTQALRDAGYAESTAKARATDIFNMPHVKAYVEKKREELQTKNVASQQEILETLTKILRRELEDVDVLPDGRIVRTEPKLNEMRQSAQLLGKFYGLDKVEVNQKVKIETVYGQDEDDRDDDSDADYFQG